ncbi:DUF998 domain-containing protein [Mycobacterium cookii]|uniref:DUF998 domain-containing protein n=1 Tax=Mycobacterium cookii TaxID=1775 RepID=A0A7I7L1Y9_9MYCO|nr:DUF998 domain-containing protein [Mycobacterium cookii]MCV7333201.1 DUF998 domain-containing protein [Mycobacterium cookii]BBX48084.1 hypothetical protein MCOO_40990 [Mycobacterium cookii]
MPSRSGLSIAWIVGPMTYLILEAVAAAAFPHYSYTQNFISDLGTSASPRAVLMNMAFCVQGTLFLVGAMFLYRAPLFLSFAAENALGNILVATFHRGVPAHGVGAVLAIVGGNAAILAGSRVGGPSYRKVSLGLGVFGLLSFAIFAVARNGAWERCSVYSILAWQLLTAVGVLWSRLDQ